MEKIREFIKEYQIIQRSKKSHHWHTNVYENINHELKCMEFVEKNIEMLENSLETYLKESTTKETFLREWLLYGIQQVNTYLHSSNQLLPSDIKEVWPIFFADDAEPFFEGYEISYYNTREIQDNMKNMLSIDNCTDEDILAIHKDKRCDCMYMCSYCDEMERVWEKRVRQMYDYSSNIFLCSKQQSEFVEKWLAANKTYSGYKWPPAKVYYDSYYQHGLVGYKKTVITDFAEMCAYIKETRKKYKEGGKTPIQCHDELCRDIQGVFNYIQPQHSDLMIFMKLWSKLELIPIWLMYDKARCKEILKML